MTQDKALNRLHWRFTQGKAFKPNQNDANALNLVFDWIARQKEINVLNSELFAKLYIYNLNQNINYHKTSVFDNTPQKDLSRILSYPIEYFYQSFHKSLHHNQLSTLNLKDGITVDDLKDKYTLEIVTDRLQHMIGEATNKFS